MTSLVNGEISPSSPHFRFLIDLHNYSFLLYKYSFFDRLRGVDRGEGPVLFYLSYNTILLSPSLTLSLLSSLISYTLPIHFTTTAYPYIIVYIPPYHTTIIYCYIAVFLYLCTMIIYLHIITLYLYTILLHYTTLLNLKTIALIIEL